jgi:hypothetical protein
MPRQLLLVLFFAALACAAMVIRTRSQIIATGNKIVTLQKELWELQELNGKLRVEYDRIATAENIIRKNTELNLSLVPPREVVCVTPGAPPRVAAMPAAEGNGNAR